MSQDSKGIWDASNSSAPPAKLKNFWISLFILPHRCRNSSFCVCFARWIYQWNTVVCSPCSILQVWSSVIQAIPGFGMAEELLKRLITKALTAPPWYSSTHNRYIFRGHIVLYHSLSCRQNCERIWASWRPSKTANSHRNTFMVCRHTMKHDSVNWPIRMYRQQLMVLFQTASVLHTLLANLAYAISGVRSTKGWTLAIYFSGGTCPLCWKWSDQRWLFSLCTSLGWRSLNFYHWDGNWSHNHLHMHGRNILVAKRLTLVTWLGSSLLSWLALLTVASRYVLEMATDHSWATNGATERVNTNHVARDQRLFQPVNRNSRFLHSFQTTDHLSAISILKWCKHFPFVALSFLSRQGGPYVSDQKWS